MRSSGSGVCDPDSQIVIQMKKKPSQGLRIPIIIFSGLIISFFILLLVALFRFVDFSASRSTKEVEKMIKKADYVKALASLENSADRMGQTDLYLQKAMVWMALAWERQNRDSWKQYGTNGRNWLDVAEADSAEKYLKEVIRIEPQQWHAHFQLGNLYVERGWFSAAEASFVSALRYNEESTDVRISLAALYGRMRKYELAEQELTTLAKRNPDHPGIAKNLGFLYRFYLDDPQRAMLWLNRYLNHADRSDRDVNFARAELENLLQRYPEYVPQEPQNWRKKSRFSAR